MDEGRFQFRWAPAGESSPTFIGSLTVRSQGAHTELLLSGEYRPTFQNATRELGAVLDDETSRATARLLLEELKAVLEMELTQAAGSAPECATECSDVRVYLGDGADPAKTIISSRRAMPARLGRIDFTVIAYRKTFGDGLTRVIGRASLPSGGNHFQGRSGDKRSEVNRARRSADPGVGTTPQDSSGVRLSGDRCRATHYQRPRTSPVAKRVRAYEARSIRMASTYARARSLGGRSSPPRRYRAREYSRYITALCGLCRRLERDA